MRTLAGIIGAIVGAIVGGVSALSIAAKLQDDDPIGIALTLIVLGPVGLIIGIILGVVLALLVFRYLKRSEPGKNGRRKKVLLVACLVLGIPCLVMGILRIALDDSASGKDTSDKAMVANFQRNQATFNQLAQMLPLDKGLRRVREDGTYDEDNPRSIRPLA